MIYAILFLAISLSLDALGLGVSYGIQGIRVPFVPKILICLSSVIYAFLGLVSGSLLLHIVGMNIANSIGILILLLMGFWMIAKSRKSNGSVENKVKEAVGQQAKHLEIAIKSIGITIMVIKDPVKGDIDKSGIIDIKEAFLLGVALNIDATAACMGITMVGVSSMLMPVLVGLVQMLLLGWGLYIGRTMINKHIVNEKLISVVPGLILVSLGLFRLLV